MFNIIDLESHPRKEIIQHYMYLPCSYSVTINLNITPLLPFIKQKQQKFYATMINLITHTVNQLKEFRMAFDKDNNLGYFDSVHPTYTIPHIEQESFSSIWSKWESLEKSYQTIIKDIDLYSQNTKFMPQNNIPPNICHISCIPTLSFTSMDLCLHKGANYLLPIFTMGKHFIQGETILLPFAIQINHIACDGFHVSRFVEQLENNIIEYCK